MEKALLSEFSHACKKEEKSNKKTKISQGLFITSIVVFFHPSIDNLSKPQNSFVVVI
jgi:hypothetical protein